MKSKIIIHLHLLNLTEARSCISVSPCRCLKALSKNSRMARFRYIKIQLKTKDITTRLRGINHINPLFYSPKPRSGVFCFKLNFNVPKLGYYPDIALLKGGT